MKTQGNTGKAPFLTMVLDGGVWSASCSRNFASRKKSPVSTGQEDR